MSFHSHIYSSCVAKLSIKTGNKERGNLLLKSVLMVCNVNVAEATEWTDD